MDKRRIDDIEENLKEPSFWDYNQYGEKFEAKKQAARLNRNSLWTLLLTVIAVAIGIIGLCLSIWW